MKLIQRGSPRHEQTVAKSVEVIIAEKVGGCSYIGHGRTLLRALS
jgi:hypothetical protein